MTAVSISVIVSELNLGDAMQSFCTWWYLIVIFGGRFQLKLAVSCRTCILAEIHAVIRTMSGRFSDERFKSTNRRDLGLRRDCLHPNLQLESHLPLRRP